MADYKVIYRADNKDEISIPWEPGCPVQVEAIQVSRDRITARTFLQLRVRNVSGEKVQSFSLRVVLTGDDGEEGIDLKFLDADISEAESFDIPPRELAVHEVAGVKCLLTEVKTMRSVWTSSSGKISVPVMHGLALSDAAASERELLIDQKPWSRDAGKRIYAVHEEGDWWSCSCGHVNVQRWSCWSCGASLTELKELQDEAFLTTSAAERAKQQAAAEEAARIKAEKEARDQAEKEEQERELAIRRKKALKKTSVIACAIAVVLAGGYVGVRFVANQAMDTEDYGRAEKLYSMIGMKEEARVARRGGLPGAHELDELFSGTVHLFDADFEYLRASLASGKIGEEEIASLAEKRYENDGYEDAVALYDMIDDEERADKVRYEYVTEVRFKNMLTEAEYKETLRAHGYPGAEDL